MATSLHIILIFISIVLMVLVLLQAKGQGFNPTFSNDSSIFRTRRGVEKTLFQMTITTAVLYTVISILSAIFTAV
ncbi:MAG: preprotein translocase subunit SecG [Chloroflexi bacterium]|nr:preprotein translocase subunit SecG [Chloroflexota bacterium]